MRGWVVVGVVLLTSAACSTSAPRGLPDQRPTIGATTSLIRCPAGTRVPVETTDAVPDAHTPATVVVRVGQAVSFPSPVGSRVRVFGSGGRALCSVDAPSGSTTVLTRSPSYVRVAVLGVGAARVLYVKITS